MAVSITTARAIALCDAQVDAFDVGTGDATIVLYDGTPPADANAALSGNNVLATLTCAATSFGAAASGGPGAVSSIVGTPSNTATATGTISFFRILNGDAVVQCQGTCSLAGGGGDMILSTLTISSVSQVITVNTFSWTQST